MPLRTTNPYRVDMGAAVAVASGGVVIAVAVELGLDVGVLLGVLEGESVGV